MSMFSEAAGAAAAAAAANAGGNLQGNKGPSTNGGGKGGKGNKEVKPLPSIPAPNTMLHGVDSDGGAVAPVEPVDLSLVAGNTLPKRKPLQFPTLGGAQITGMSGVFVP